MSHVHQHTETKNVINRLSRAIGHLESVKRMIEDGRDCTEVLIQIAAVRSALSSTAKVILKDHLEHCITEDQSASEQIQALNEAIEHNALNFAYIRRVVDSWICSGYKSAAEIREDKARYRLAATARGKGRTQQPEPPAPAPRFFSERWG